MKIIRTVREKATGTTILEEVETLETLMTLEVKGKVALIGEEEVDRDHCQFRRGMRWEAKTAEVREDRFL